MTTPAQDLLSWSITALQLAANMSTAPADYMAALARMQGEHSQAPQPTDSVIRAGQNLLRLFWTRQDREIGFDSDTEKAIAANADHKRLIRQARNPDELMAARRNRYSLYVGQVVTARRNIGAA
jgi:hypothetical protein